MEPRIQYTRSADGTRIGFWVLGTGRPLVIAPSSGLFSIHTGWQIPSWRENVQRLAEKRAVVLYDCRGEGFSSRDVTDFSLDAQVADLEAVADQIGSASTDLIANGLSTNTAIAYAARHFERVRRLVLGSAARGRDLRHPQWRALESLLELDWDLYLQARALVTVGWTEAGRIVAEMAQKNVNRETVVAYIAEWRRADVTDLLPAVRCPTLVLHRDDLQWMPVETARELAAAIPNARLVTYAEDERLIVAGPAWVRLVEEFLDEDAEAALEQPLPSGMTAILFADIADSTALTERLGDSAFRGKARELGGTLRALIRECAGTPVEGPTLGDGVLAVFPSAREAIEAARRCGKAGDEAGLPLHLGLHAGDITREKDPDGRDNVYGGAVNIAARISGLSAPGEVLVSETVRSLARTSAGVGFEDRGEQALKGVGEAVRVWAVVEGEA